MNDEAEHHSINTDDKPIQKISHYNYTYKTCLLYTSDAADE